MSSLSSPLDDEATIAPVPGRVLGIDPGLNVTGYAVLEPGPGGRASVLEAGVIRGGAEGSRMGARLDRIYQGILEVINALHPASMALEQVHSHVNHPRTAILMAHARGILFLAAARQGVPVVSYAATRIKKTITGHGHAGKEQMQRAIQAELGLPRLPEPPDVADALAAALCHYYTQKKVGGAT